MSFSTRTLAVLVFFALTLFLEISSTAAIPPNSEVSTKQIGSSPQTFKEVTLPEGILLIYDPPQNANPTEFVKKLLVKRDNWCLGSSFINKTSRGSPLVSDCEIIRNEAYRRPQTLFVPVQPGGFARVYAFRSCQFGVRARSVPIKMGNEDVGDLVRDSINTFRFRFDDGVERVGTEGSASCITLSGNPTSAMLEWAIFRT